MRRSNTTARGGGHQGPAGQSPSHPASHGVKRKVRHTEVRKGKIPEAKGRQDNLSKKRLRNKAS